MKLILSVVILVTSLAAGSEACSCMPPSIIPLAMDLYCNNDFVIRVQVESNEVIGDNRVYTTTLLEIARVKGSKTEIFKQNPINDAMEIYTPSDGALCGAYLQNESRYLLAGNVVNGTAYIYSCMTFKYQALTSKEEQLIGKQCPDDCLDYIPKV